MFWGQPRYVLTRTQGGWISDPAAGRLAWASGRWGMVPTEGVSSTAWLDVWGSGRWTRDGRPGRWVSATSCPLRGSGPVPAPATIPIHGSPAWVRRPLEVKQYTSMIGGRFPRTWVLACGMEQPGILRAEQGSRFIARCVRCPVWILFSYDRGNRSTRNCRVISAKSSSSGS